MAGLHSDQFAARRANQRAPGEEVTVMNRKVVVVFGVLLLAPAVVGILHVLAGIGYRVWFWLVE